MINDSLVLGVLEQCRQQATGHELICTITATAGDLLDGYPTPIRKVGNKLIFGFVVVNLVELKVICECIDGKVGYVFTDVEKKLRLKRGAQDGNSYIDTGNLFKACKLSLSSTPTFPLKPNDLTVDAVFLNLINIFSDLSGVKVGLLGVGNIGTKLALKLVEAGCEVGLYSRDFQKVCLVQNTIESVKNVGVISGVRVFRDTRTAVFGVDCVLLCASAEVLDLETALMISSDAYVLDVGKSNATEEAFEYLIESDIRFSRLDYSTALAGYITMLLDIDKSMRSKTGRLQVGNQAVVSGGYLGKKGDVVVDDINNPTLILGVCNGKGGMTQLPMSEQAGLIDELNFDV